MPYRLKDSGFVMQLAGELSKISLPSLIQLVRNGGLTGEISISQGTNNATIYVEQGRIIHVESDIGEGREAFLELFLWLTGTFSFVESKLSDIARTFPADEPMDRLLREGVAYLEEKKYLDQLRINGQTVLKPTAAARTVEDVPLLERLDGRKTLAQALSDANLSRRAYVKAVYQVLSEGLVLVADPVAQGDQVNLPGWVVARLKQDNPDLSQAIVDMVIWVDRIKCWMYQADADLERITVDLGGGGDELLAAQMSEQARSPVADSAAEEEESEDTLVRTLGTSPSAGVAADPSQESALPAAPGGGTPAVSHPSIADAIASAASTLNQAPTSPPRAAAPAPAAEPKQEPASKEEKPVEKPLKPPGPVAQPTADAPAQATQSEESAPPQAIPKAPWTRATMGRRPYAGGTQEKPVRPPSIEF